MLGRSELIGAAVVEVTLDESVDGAQVAKRTVTIELPSTDPVPKIAYEGAALSGFFYTLQRVRALRGDDDLPAVSLATLRIAIAQPGVTTDQIAELAADATYRALSEP